MTKKKTGPHEPNGRPTKYDPKYCEMLIDHMASGFSFESFAGAIHVSRQTIYDWEKVWPSFLDAKKIGAERNLLFWEEQGQKGLWEETEYNDQGRPISKKTLNTSVWIFNMKNRHRWKDKHEDPVDPNKDKENSPQIIVMLPDNGTSTKKEVPKKDTKGKKNGGKL